MLCPYCKEPNTQVIDSRTCEEGSAIRPSEKMSDLRRPLYNLRESGHCRCRSSSRKTAAFGKPTTAINCAARCRLHWRKRPVKASELDSAISRIEKQLQVSGEKEVTSKRVGDMVMLELKKLDNVAYVRYGSVYFNCGTLDDMIKLVENAREDQGKEGK